MLGAGLLAKNAVERGLKTRSYIKTSLSPGSGVVTYYLEESGVKRYLEELGLVVLIVLFIIQLLDHIIPDITCPGIYVNIWLPISVTILTSDVIYRCNYSDL